MYAAAGEDAAAIGFDDDTISKELSLPMAGKSLPMQQMLRADAVRVFNAWRDKEDKVPY